MDAYRTTPFIVSWSYAGQSGIPVTVGVSPSVAQSFLILETGLNSKSDCWRSRDTHIF